MNASETAMTICVSYGSSSLAPRSLKIVLKDGMTHPRRMLRTPAEDDEDGARIDHRALDLAAELDGLLVVDREAVEDRVEDTADLTCLDEVDVELRRRSSGGGGASR